MCNEPNGYTVPKGGYHLRNLRAFRKAARMSASDLAKLAGVTITSIYRYEHGMRVPPADIAARLAHALGCTVEDLIGVQDEQGQATA